jgi:hypothetical protein
MFDENYYAERNQYITNLIEQQVKFVEKNKELIENLFNEIKSNDDNIKKLITEFDDLEDEIYSYDVVNELVDDYRMLDELCQLDETFDMTTENAKFPRECEECSPLYFSLEEMLRNYIIENYNH